MTKSFPWYFFAVMATTCRSGFAFVGFVPKAFVPASVKMNSSGLSESSDENSNKITNPSSAFGSPLSQNTADFNKSLVGFLKRMTFDNIYSSEGREFARFYALETIARVPYFSYLSALHLYETLGRWRKAKYLRLHFAESWNELHHLMIMEELGGSDLFFDRFFAQHVAVGYYLFTLVLYFVNPTLAYNFNQQIEEHAYLVYDRFLNDNEEKLKSLPAPKTAIEYYRDGDLYMFDAMQVETCEPRRPVINTLYDVFVAIRDDELEHVRTMAHLQTNADLNTSHDDTCSMANDADLSNELWGATLNRVD